MPGTTVPGFFAPQKRRAHEITRLGMPDPGLFCRGGSFDQAAANRLASDYRANVKFTLICVSTSTGWSFSKYGL
jgi:hypothetical protein